MTIGTWAWAGLPTFTVLRKTIINGEYLRINDALGALHAAMVGDFDLRFLYRKGELDGQEHMWTSGGGGQNQGFDIISSVNIPGGMKVIVWMGGGNRQTEFAINNATSFGNIWYSSTSPLALRITRDSDNGSAQQVWTVYVGPTIDGPWTQIGQGTMSLGDPATGTAPMYLWSQLIPSGSSSPNAGNVEIYKCRIYPNAGGSGSPIVDADFTQLEPLPVANVSDIFTDDAGTEWQYSIVDFVAS